MSLGSEEIRNINFTTTVVSNPITWRAFHHMHISRSWIKRGSTF